MSYKSEYVSVAPSDHRRLPTAVAHAGVLVSRARVRAPKALISLQHSWILHNRLLVRVAIAAFVALVFATAFQTRGGIMNGVSAVSASLSSGLATGGLRISAIDISGQVITTERSMLNVLGIDENTSILGYDVDAARARLLAMPAISDVTIRKIYPNRLAVNVVEKEPFARWSYRGDSFLIDEKGAALGLSSVAYEELPLVVGDGAFDDARVMIQALERFDVLRSGLVGMSRIADRRWDLIYDTGLRIQLPEVGVGQALVALVEYQRDHQLLDRDLTLIDLRVAGSIVVRLTQRDQEKAS